MKQIMADGVTEREEGGGGRSITDFGGQEVKLPMKQMMAAGRNVSGMCAERGGGIKASVEG